jgi:hypothetical protein
MSSSLLGRVLETGNPDLFAAVLAQCAPADLMARVAPVCKDWAGAVEVALRGRCVQRQWKLARRPRGALSQLWPYRTLWVQRVCRGCLSASGDYAVRDTPRGGTLFLLCRHCCLSERVRLLLVERQLCLDTLGLSGAPMQKEGYGRGGKRKVPP